MLFKLYNIFSGSLMLIMLMATSSFAQRCEAESMFNQHFAKSKNHLAEQKCVNIRISEIYKPENHDMVYRWNTGDGQQETGLDITHCYEEYGKYRATLDAVLPETEFLSENEMSLDVVIKEPVKVEINSVITAEIDQNTSFHFSLSPLITYEIDQTWWQVGDSVFYCGNKQLTHQFSVPGSYQVKLLIRLENLDGYFYISDQVTIEVKGNNVFGHELETFFQDHENSNPFLKDQVHLAVISTSDKTSFQHELKLKDSLCFLLPANHSYELYLWRGNRYSQPVKFSTKDCADSLATFTVIRSVVKNVLQGKVEILPPVEFGLNEKTMDRKVKKSLKRNAKRLKALAGFTCTIGSYTHTGGALHVNLDYSDARSLLVKEFLESKMKGKIHLMIADAREAKCLINTSYSVEKPTSEDERLNGKTYLKIEGIEKAR